MLLAHFDSGAVYDDGDGYLHIFAQEGFRLSYSVSLGIAVFVTLLLSFLFIRFLRTLSKRGAIKR